VSSSSSALRAVAAVVLVVAAAAPELGCLSVDPTDGALRCSAEPDRCPPGYRCAADQHCWRGQSTGADSGPAGDAGPQPDGGVAEDLAVPPADLAGDAAPPPVGPDLMPVMAPSFCPTGALFCGGFESGSITPEWTSTYVQPNVGQTLAVGGGQVHSGSFALRGAASSSSDSWALAQYDWAGTKAPLTLRMWVRPTSALTKHGMVARVLNRASGHGFQVGASVGGANWTVAENLSTDHDSTVAIATGSWSCFELVIPASGEVKLFVNGSTTAAVHFTPASTGDSYDELHGGVEWAPAGIPVDVWIDDIVMATTRLPCP
jgi:hypothetical protein